MTVEQFKSDLRGFVVNLRLPHSMGQCSYQEYLALSDEERGDDEQDIVDMRLAVRLVELLGYAESDWTYNRNKERNRPDFIVRAGARIVFFVEDKRTSLSLDPETDQVRRYLESISNTGLLFNGHEICGFRRIMGHTVPLFRFNLRDAFPELSSELQAPMSFLQEDAVLQLEQLYELFRKDRFTDVEERISSLTTSEEQWFQEAKSVVSYQDTFIEEAQRMIRRLAGIAFTSLLAAFRQVRELEEILSHCRGQWQEYLLQMSERGPWDVADASGLLTEGNILGARLGYLSDQEIMGIGRHLTREAVRSAVVRELKVLNEQVHYRVLHRELVMSIVSRYRHWVDLQQTYEEGSRLGEVGQNQEQCERNRRLRFVRQCAYVFFLKLMLLRVLEDKSIISPRLISDGGFQAWVHTVRPRYVPQQEEHFAGAHLLRLSLECAAGHYGELTRPDVYDWFMPDDVSILDTLEILAGYNFSEISTDLIGYTYQRFLEESERHRLGHYLTPPSLVDYILDEAGYSGSNPEIIGKKVIDPACGSGSFLVHAARRYRDALVRSYETLGNRPEERELELAATFLRDTQSNFTGVDLNPFSCYLARINLLIQVLDDYQRLRQAGRTPVLTGFHIINGDSLDFAHAGAGLMDESIDDIDPLRALKVQGENSYGYVFANPPYVNRKLEDVGTDELRNQQFYRGWTRGDTNTYLLFLRVGLHYLQPHGSLAYVAPLTVLGDRQSREFRTRALEHVTPISLTRFYSETVLFRGIFQIVSVLVLRREKPSAEALVLVKGGGYGQGHAEAIEDTQSRLSICRPLDDIVWRLSPAGIPQRGLEAGPDGTADGWHNSWLVLPEKEGYYELFRALVKGSSLTVSRLLLELGVNPDRQMSQGDVNTTHVARFHVARGTTGAMPLYKGNQIRLLVPLTYEPRAGPRGRSPFVRLPSDDVQSSLSAEQRRASRQLRRVSELDRPEYGFVLHETAKVRVRRRIRGTYFQRGPSLGHPVFTHKLWVFRLADPTTSKALLGLLTSAPICALYSCISTNNSVTQELLLSLPVPSGFAAIKHVLVEVVDHAMSAAERLSQSLIRYRGEYSVEPDHRSGEVSVDPCRFLEAEHLPTVQVRDYWLRGWLVRDDGAQHQRIGTLVRSGRIRVELPIPGLEDTFDLWTHKFADLRWDEFVERAIPDNPSDFLDRWNLVTQQARDQLGEYIDAIQRMDSIVGNWYGLSNQLQDILERGFPWSVGVEDEAEE